MRGDGQKGLILMVQEDFLAEIDTHFPKLGFSDRATFIRAAVHKYLADHGVSLPLEYKAAPPRIGKAKGGRPKKVAKPLAVVKSKASSKVFCIPFLHLAAGSPIVADAEMIEVDKDYGKGRFMIQLHGDSMEPQFKDGQRIVLRDKSKLSRPLLKYGQLYAFIHDGSATFKVWAKDKSGNKVLRSLNPDHSDIPADENTDWIGWYDEADNPK